ncbi:bromodomain containing 7 [Moniliophthora roreri]|uniref:Bromo domain-containing protein n=1 Tax=Moniliophthora roreri TaxID=221103 RepID=A0A0W0F0C5_MONRR|nr:bromodomain containing 7 [Moniliophthora roreri]
MEAPQTTLPKPKSRLLMDELDTVSVEDFDSQPDSPAEPALSRQNHSGITLVLPSLKSLKAANAAKKGKSKSSPYPQGLPQKAPRPVKLKPLKEVLTRLIAQIKKKDDYAFFLQPVDTTQVAGYTDIVKHPMDFGTMTTKVNRGRYRSLEEFADDFRLVTNNAKLFNPPGTIYYTEAQRIETWGLDHIAKASATVIQYETDWNIDVEKDDDPNNVSIEEDIDPMDIDTPAPPDLSSAVPSGSSSRRSTRGPYRKAATPAASTSNAATSLLESIDAEGRLPGSKDGLGAFPAGSDLAKTMLALKLKGKRYKTKKERLRVEKEGPPLRADGSLDYSEMEDPFPVFAGLVPQPSTRPYLAPLYPPLYQSLSNDPSMSQTPQPPTRFPTAINVAPNRPAISTVPPDTSSKFRYWTIQRNATSRSRARDKEDEREDNDDADWKLPREAHSTDFGSFALLAAEIAEEIKRRETFKDEEDGLFSIVRESLDIEAAVSRLKPQQLVSTPLQNHWSPARALEGEGYIRDVVYGGSNGLAYVRSIAEFLSPTEVNNTRLTSVDKKPLAKWAEQKVVDSLTAARHALIRETARRLANLPQNPRDITDPLTAQVYRSLHVYPAASNALVALLQIRAHKIDMGALIKSPEELFASERVLVAKIIPPKDTAAMDIDLPASEGDGDMSSAAVSVQAAGMLETPEELDQVLAQVAKVILESNIKVKASRNPAPGKGTTPTDTDLKSMENVTEDNELKDIRLNLLALAKRAPIDTIARLPRDLFPESIRQLVPGQLVTPSAASQA